MPKNYKVHTKHKKSSAKKASKRPPTPLLQFVSRNRNIIIKTVIIATIVVVIAGFIPLPHTFTKNTSVPFATENTKSADLELGESKTTQVGRDGKKTVNIESYQSLWGRALGWQPIQQKEVDSIVTEKPINKVVANGTKKYQYMLCSDGSYRYYTDEQFKDPQTGFTSKSEDHCKKNGQGEMIQLSDTSTGNGATRTEREPAVTVRDGCTYTSIPYKTVYRDVPWLNKGETRVSEGIDGIKSSCGWSTNPKDQEILRGTGDSSSNHTLPEGANSPDQNAYNQCLNSYNSAMSQIQASASQGMGGTEALKRQVEAEFSRCKRNAGY